jgi:hypothetical protein
VADENKGTDYWVTQIVVLGVFGIGLLVAGIWMWSTDFDNHAGDGFMAFLGATLFLGVMLKVVSDYRGMSAEQRAAYAWAITQMHAADAGSDVVQMKVAAKARAGTLTPEEVRILEAMRPGHPYPGGTHVQGGTGAARPLRYDTPNQATAWSIVTIIGFVLSFFPVVSLMGLVLSGAAFRHLGRTGKPRRLPLAGILISIIMLAVTVALLVILASLGHQSICAELGPGEHIYDGTPYTCE